MQYGFSRLSPSAISFKGCSLTFLDSGDNACNTELSNIKYYNLQLWVLILTLPEWGNKWVRTSLDRTKGPFQELNLGPPVIKAGMAMWKVEVEGGGGREEGEEGCLSVLVI